MKDYNAADADFVTQMIGHHLSAIDMVTAYLENSQNREIQNWAIDIISGQMNEVMRKQYWLSDRKLPIPDSPTKHKM